MGESLYGIDEFGLGKYSAAPYVHIAGTLSATAVLSGAVQAILSASGTLDIPAVAFSGDAQVVHIENASGTLTIPAVVFEAAAQRTRNVSGSIEASADLSGAVQRYRNASGLIESQVALSGAVQTVRNVSGTLAAIFSMSGDAYGGPYWVETEVDNVLWTELAASSTIWTPQPAGAGSWEEE